MDEGARRQQLFREMRAAGFEADRTRNSGHWFNGTRHVAGRDVSVTVVFLDLEFTRLPAALLRHPQQEAPEVVAHLDRLGGLCFARHGDILLDRYNIPGSVQLCVELIDKGLERALTHQRLQNEIAAEFPQHWGGTTFYYDLPRGDRFAQEPGPAHFVTLEDGRHLLSETRTLPQRFGCGAKATKGLKPNATVIYTERELTFQRGHGRPKNLGEFIAYCTAEGHAQRADIVRLLTKQSPFSGLIFLHAPNGCVGIRVVAQAERPRPGFRAVSNAERIRSSPGACDVARFSGSRADLVHIFERNMHQQTPLTATNITLVGCGTIGSHLAKMLVQSGAGHSGGRLLLIDDQSLEPGNIGRHYLGPIHIAHFKSKALQEELQRSYPDARVVAHTDDALASTSLFAKDALVIDATGEEGVGLALNDHLYNSEVARLHVALFGNGAAAQALLVDGHEYGCYRCLKTPDGRQWRFDPMKSGFAPQEKTAACGEGQFIPYAVAAPATAAGLALQLALAWRSGNPSPRLRTMRIDPEVTRQVGDKNPSKMDGCPACKEREAEAV